MITDKLTIFGDSEDVTAVCDLICKCSQLLDVQLCECIVYIGDVSEPCKASADKAVIVPYEYKDKITQGRVMTYSATQTAADVASLNLQKRENALCFEVLSGAQMSRVFIPYNTNCTQSQVLVCAGVLCASGVSVNKAVETINSILK